MSRSFDTVVVGGGTNGLVAAIVLARGGSKVLLVEAGTELGGTLREIEFAPGFHAAPLAHDAGYVAPQVMRATGLGASAGETLAGPTLLSLGGEPLALHRDVARTQEGLRRRSRADAERWADFSRHVGMLSGFLAELYRSPAPRIDASGFGEF